MIGSFLSVKEVGLYAVAFKIAFVSSFFLQVTNAVLAPKIASLFAENKVKDLEKTIQKVTTNLTLIGLGGLVVIILVAPYALKLWGDVFTAAYIPLIILSVGQFFNISAGCVGLALSMCGQQKILGRITLFTAILNTILNFSLIQIWGLTGAAISTSLTLIAGNALGIYFNKTKLNITFISLKIYKLKL